MKSCRTNILTCLKDQTEIIPLLANSLLNIVARPTRLYIPFLISSHFFFVEKIFTRDNLDAEFAKKMHTTIDNMAKKSSNFALISFSMFV